MKLLPNLFIFLILLCLKECKNSKKNSRKFGSKSSSKKLMNITTEKNSSSVNLSNKSSLNEVDVNKSLNNLNETSKSINNNIKTLNITNYDSKRDLLTNNSTISINNQKNVNKIDENLKNTTAINKIPIPNSFEVVHYVKKLSNYGIEQNNAFKNPKNNFLSTIGQYSF